MHKSSIVRMKWFVDTYVSKIQKESIKVLDIGSYDVNGSYKSLFQDAKFEYTGTDMAAGPNVDVVLKTPYAWTEFETDSFDIVISGQTFEHTEFFWVTMSEMARVLKKDGLLCLIAPNGFNEHRYPIDCYRFFCDGMVALARYVCLEILHAHTNSAPNKKEWDPGLKALDWYSMERDFNGFGFGGDSILIAKKPYSGKAQYVNMETYVCIPPDQEKLRSGFIPQSKMNPFARLVHKIYRFTMTKIDR